MRKDIIAGKSITLYTTSRLDRPLVVLNAHSGDGGGVWEELSKMTDAAGSCDPGINLLVVSGLDWNCDMTPWSCPPL